MKKFTKMLVLSLAMVMTLGMGTVAEAKGTVKSVKITKVAGKKVSKKTKKIVVKRGATDKKIVLAAKVSVKGGASKKYTVKSSKPAVVAVAEDGKNLVAKKAGTAKITVASKANKKKKATIKVEVKQLVTEIQPTVKKAVATWNDGANVTLVVGGKGYKVSNTFAVKPSNKKVSYKSSNKKVVKVTKAGKLTAKKAGTATITVTAKDGSKVNAKINVQVLPKKYTKVTSVTTTPETVTLDVVKTKTAQLTTTVAPTEATYKTVEYTSSNEEVAVVDMDGNVTAVAAGEAVITVKAVDGSNVQDTVKVVVKADVTSITATADKTSIKVGETATVKATVNTDAYDATVAFTSSDEKVATVDKATGVVTGVAVGKATITATAVNGKTATVEITVTAADTPVEPEKPVEKVTKISPKTGAVESTVKFVGTAAQVEKDIVDALTAAGAEEATKVIKLDGVEKTLKFADGKLYVGDKLFSETVTTEGTVAVEVTEKMVDYFKALELASIVGGDFKAYSMTIGKHVFTNLVVANGDITVEVDGTAYTAKVVNGALCINGELEAGLLQDLKDEGVVDVVVE